MEMAFSSKVKQISRRLKDVFSFNIISTLLLAILAFPGLASAKSQVISFSTDTTHYYPSEEMQISVMYEASDKGLATGVGVRVHFDSSQVSIDSISETLRLGKVGVQVKSDSEDYDDDPLTDQYINAAWASVDGGWPGSLAQPAPLLQILATTSDEFSGTQMNITIASTDVNYFSSGASLSLTSTVSK
jgi:hypothetical protein